MIYTTIQPFNIPTYFGISLCVKFLVMTKSYAEACWIIVRLYVCVCQKCISFFLNESNICHVLTSWHFLFWQKYSTSVSSLTGSLNSLKEKNQRNVIDINKCYWTIAFWIHTEIWKVEKEWKYTSAPTHAFVMCTETVLSLPCHC
jgi:hypothetical protein